MRYFGALDLAKVSGACAGLPFERPEVCTWNLGSGLSVGDRMTRMRRAIRRWAEDHGPDKVFVEAPMSPAALVSAGATAATVLALNGYVAVALGELADLGIESQLVERQDALGHFVGKRRFKVKDDGKRACVARCKQLGWPVETFDEADAVALWDYGCALENGVRFAQHAAQRRKMF